jgi:hypothetical protein
MFSRRVHPEPFLFFVIFVAAHPLKTLDSFGDVHFPTSRVIIAGL